MTTDYTVEYQMRWLKTWKRYGQPFQLQDAMKQCEKLQKVFDCRTRIVKRTVVEKVIAEQE